MTTSALKTHVESANRRIAARTMDGFKICARVSINFARPVPATDAEATLGLYARAFARALEDQLSEGRLPFHDTLLHARMTKIVNVLPPERVRVSELHVASSSSSRPPATGRSGGLTAPPPSVTSLAVPAGPQRTISGVLPAQRQQARTSGFALAIERWTGPLSAASAGSLLAGPLRDAVASLLLGAFDAVSDSVEDPLRLVDGRLEQAIRQALVTEAAACVSFILYDALMSKGIAQRVAVLVTEGASSTVVMGERVPGSQISRYLALENPLHALAERLCLLLGVTGSADIEQRLGFLLNTVRADARLCADLLLARASRTG